MSLGALEFNKIRDFLYSRTGIYLKENKLDFLSRRVISRMRELDLRTVGDYIRYLEFGGTSNELENLVEMVVINETYFFRDYNLLRLFSETVLPSIVQDQKGSRKLRLLSAGCSTGDEPYTLAIILREMLEAASSWNLHIDGVDISERVLKIARDGIYTAHALRETPYLYRDKYFDNKGPSYLLKSEIKTMVELLKVNLFDINEMSRLPTYDVVFCRNVLIYFDTFSGSRVMEHLYDRMNRGAYIFLGPSESVGRLSNLFEIVPFGKLFAYRKA